MADNTMDFMQLKLGSGQLLQLEFESYSSDRDKSVLIGCRKDTSILVTISPDRRVKVGDKLNVRFFHSRMSSACAFQSEVLYATKLPFAYAHIRMPDSVIIGEVRQSIRVDVDLESRVLFQKGEEVKNSTVRITDLSLDGARILGPAFDFLAGAEILLVFTVNVTGIEHEMIVQATVQTLQTTDRGVTAGLQFHDLPGNDQIALQAFVLTHIHDL